ncbi:MAG TPA: hypothetical protein PLP88_06205 [Bacteroidales bacterium]|nr:hypothetical protein [Bacteroidales bacterium]
MKMISNLLGSLSGIQWYYIAGMLIFIPMFIILVMRTLRMPRSEAENIKQSILNDNDSATSKQ